MKKLLIALMLIAVVITPMFAADGNKDLAVKTTVAEISEYGFTEAQYTDAKTALTLITGEQVIADGAKFFASVRTNSNAAVSVKLYNTDLVKGTDTITLKLNNSEAYNDAASALGLINNAETANLRAISEAFTLNYDASAASAGEYKATITMVVTGA